MPRPASAPPCAVQRYATPSLRRCRRCVLAWPPLLASARSLPASGIGTHRRSARAGTHPHTPTATHVPLSSYTTRRAVEGTLLDGAPAMAVTSATFGASLRCPQASESGALHRVPLSAQLSPFLCLRARAPLPGSLICMSRTRAHTPGSLNSCLQLIVPIASLYARASHTRSVVLFALSSAFACGSFSFLSLWPAWLRCSFLICSCVPAHPCPLLPPPLLPLWPSSPFPPPFSAATRPRRGWSRFRAEHHPTYYCRVTMLLYLVLKLL